MELISWPLGILGSPKCSKIYPLPLGSGCVAKQLFDLARGHNNSERGS